MKTKMFHKPVVTQAKFGFDVQRVLPLISPNGDHVQWNFGWITLRFGRQASGSQFVLAATSKHSFLLSDAPPATVEYGKQPRRNTWVYRVEELPIELFKGHGFPPILRVGGFKVIPASDLLGRRAVYVSLPAGGIKLLFRNPACKVSRDWRPGMTDWVDPAPVGKLKGNNSVNPVGAKSLHVLHAPQNPRLGIAGAVVPQSSPRDTSMDELFAMLFAIDNHKEISNV